MDTTDLASPVPPYNFETISNADLNSDFLTRPL